MGPMEVQMRKRFLVGVGAALALAAFSATDASACGGRRACGSYYAPPAYSYAPAPPSAYGYLPPGPAYGYAPPPAAYGPPVGVGYGYAPAGYGFYGDAGYAGYRGCDRGYGYGYAPPVAYDGYRPAAVWVPVR
jgi:hypothetical protein